MTSVLPNSILSFSSLQPMLLRVTLIPAALASCNEQAASAHVQPVLQHPALYLCRIYQMGKA